MSQELAYLLFTGACVGHAVFWFHALNAAYSQPLPKAFLKPFRVLVGLIILLGPIVLILFDGPNPGDAVREAFENGSSPVLLCYLLICIVLGLGVFPVITVTRLLRKTPVAVRSEQTRTLDLWPELGTELLGDGKYRLLARLPGNGIFQVDFTELTLELPGLPPEWDGLTILHLSDIHFIGTPSLAYFHRVVDELTAGDPPDIIAVTGDFVDTLTHHRWIIPVLGRLKCREQRLAVVGNHDVHYQPERVRRRLRRLGYRVLGKWLGTGPDPGRPRDRARQRTPVVQPASRSVRLSDGGFPAVAQPHS